MSYFLDFIKNKAAQLHAVHKSFHVFTVRKRCGKVMFSHGQLTV